MEYNKTEDQRPKELDDKLVLADQIYAAHPNSIRYCVEKKTFYQYKDGYYQPLNDIDVEIFFVMLAKGEYEAINYLTVHGLKCFCRRYAQLSHISYDSFNQADVLNLSNGLLNVNTGTFEEHKPEVFSTIRIPYSYDKDAECPAWLAFINSSLEGDANRIKVLQEFMGYCLGRDNSFQKALFLLGEPGAGKGTLIKVVEQLVGTENCSALALGQMNDEQSIGNLVDKLINVDADVSISAKGFEADFRRITGGDKITAKLLYKDKFSFRPYCKLILAANELPHISDKTRAFFRRMIVIPFNVSFEGKEDRDLDRKLQAEISGILNWALIGRRRLYEQKTFSMSQDLVGYVEEIKRNNNPVELYFHECIGFHDDVKTSKKELFANYVEYCEDNNYRALGHARFSNELMRHWGDKTKPNYRNPHGNREYMWPNIYIKGKNDPAPIQPEVKWEDS